jgi:hypothetical protein
MRVRHGLVSNSSSSSFILKIDPSVKSFFDMITNWQRADLRIESEETDPPEIIRGTAEGWAHHAMFLWFDQPPPPWLLAYYVLNDDMSPQRYHTELLPLPKPRPRHAKIIHDRTPIPEMDYPHEE